MFLNVIIAYDQKIYVPFIATRIVLTLAGFIRKNKVYLLSIALKDLLFNYFNQITILIS